MSIDATSGNNLVGDQALEKRALGSLLGLAIGDALGTTVEFESPGSFEPLTHIVGGGPFKLKPGQWTDDTSMALCLADSIVECREFAPADQMRRYVRWMRKAYLSSNGRCFDIGNTVRTALFRFEADGAPYAGSTAPSSAGNGSLMRLAPVPIAWHRQPSLAIENCAKSSRTTHGARESVDACRYYGGLIIGALQGRPKEELLSSLWTPPGVDHTDQPLAPKIEQVTRGSFKKKSPPEIRGSGYVVDSLEAALWALHNSESFDEGCLLAANLGEDADTTAAIYGQLAGALYGVNKIPEAWLTQLAERQTIERMALALLSKPPLQSPIE